MKAGVLFVITLTLSLVFGGLLLANYLSLYNKCVGHLERASNANTVEMAIPEMEKALAYVEKKGWTEGYTSLLIRTPDEDLGFWYQNLKSSLEELKTVNDTTSSMTTSNLLMKLKETLIEHSPKDSSGVTYPSGLSRYPYNWWYAFGGIVLAALWIWFFIKVAFD